MKYCVNYSNRVNMTSFDEISIIYESQDSALIQFLQEHDTQKINLIVGNIPSFYENKEWIKLNAIKEKYPQYNFSICFGGHSAFYSIDDTLKECMMALQVPYYTGMYVNNYDQLHYLAQQGVSEVYLVEDMCFDLKRAKRVCAAYDIRIRAFPNVAQSYRGLTAEILPLASFFIRPDDVSAYSEYIDVLEFYGPLDRQKIFYDIYTGGPWYGDLKDIIYSLPLSLDSMRIVPGFAHARINCKRECAKGGHCNICNNINNIEKKFKEYGMLLKTK